MVDFDIPFSFAFVVAPLIESVAIIGIMASVMWQVLFVAFFAIVASKYVQVSFIFQLNSNIFLIFIDERKILIKKILY